MILKINTTGRRDDLNNIGEKAHQTKIIVYVNLTSVSVKKWL
jgi:hypothetical protein